jgi:hypothetical protein
MIPGAVIVLVLCVFGALGWLWREAAKAPDGYEDSTGFHSRTQNKERA